MSQLFKLLILLLLFSCTNNKENTKGENTNISITEKSKKEISIKNNNADTTEYKILRLSKSYRFEDFKVPIYKEVLAEPNFKGNPYANDKEYKDFIMNGCEENNINFAGHYTIIIRSCGAECSHIFLVDRKNGNIFTDIKPNDGRYGYEFRKDSELLIANANLFIDEQFEKYIDYWCMPELYKWDKNNFILIK